MSFINSQNHQGEFNKASAGSVYFKLTALWVLCEAMLGGMIHGLKIPVSGLLVGSCAVVCICLLAWYVPARGTILKATLTVAVFKMMLSPQAPPPAYIAVFFQGLLGELLFSFRRKYFFIACLLLAVLSLLESGLQRILVLTIVYGNDLWKVVNDFINGLTQQTSTTNYSLWLGTVYVGVHFLVGIIVGWWAAVLPAKIKKWQTKGTYLFTQEDIASMEIPLRKKKKRWFRKIMFISWIVLLLLYLQSYFQIGLPLLPTAAIFKILIRSVLIILGWIFIVGPVLKFILHRWLQNKQTKLKSDIQAIVSLLPSTQKLVLCSWKKAGIQRKGWQRIRTFFEILLANTLQESTEGEIRSDKQRTAVTIITGPIHTGKTTQLQQWIAQRKDVYGICTPVVNGKRVFENIETKEQFHMEALNSESEVLSVGRYQFSWKNFEKACAIIRQPEKQKDILIIDEIGPLELQNKGFSKVLNEMLVHHQAPIILIVREGLVREVQQFFNITDVNIIDANNENIKTGLNRMF